MTPDKHQLLGQLFARLCFQAGMTPEQFSHRRTRFVRSLSAYPDDLLCAAYHHALRHTLPHQPPCEEALIEFMMPEFYRRQQQSCLEAV